MPLYPLASEARVARVRRRRIASTGGRLRCSPNTIVPWTRSGIDVASTVVVYGYGAALGFWLLTAR